VQARAGSPFCGVLDAVGPPCLTANVSEIVHYAMKHFAKALFALLTLSCFAGCMHTVLSGPCGKSPDKKYEVYIEKHGRSAHAYTDYTVKKVGVSIMDLTEPEKKQVFGEWAILEAADLLSTCTWQDASSVRVHFFERKDESKTEVDRGFVLIKKDATSGRFQVVEHSKNVRIKRRNYFF
jgi:hypothetical protein